METLYEPEARKRKLQGNIKSPYVVLSPIKKDIKRSCDGEYLPTSSFTPGSKGAIAFMDLMKVASPEAYEKYRKAHPDAALDEDFAAQSEELYSSGTTDQRSPGESLIVTPPRDTRTPSPQPDISMRNHTDTEDTNAPPRRRSSARKSLRSVFEEEIRHRQRQQQSASSTVSSMAAEDSSGSQPRADKPVAKRPSESIAAKPPAPHSTTTVLTSPIHEENAADKALENEEDDQDGGLGAWLIADVVMLLLCLWILQQFSAGGLTFWHGTSHSGESPIP